MTIVKIHNFTKETFVFGIYCEIRRKPRESVSVVICNRYIPGKIESRTVSRVPNYFRLFDFVIFKLIALTEAPLYTL